MSAPGVDRFFDLLDQIVRVGDRCRRHIRGTMCREDLGHVLFGTLVPKRLRTGRACGGAGIIRGSPGPLDAGVHVGLVVVTDIGNVVTAFERTADAEHPDIERRAVSANHEDLLQRPCFLSDASIPEATADAFSKSEWIHGTFHAVSGYGVEKTSMQPVARPQSHSFPAALSISRAAIASPHPPQARCPNQKVAGFVCHDQSTSLRRPIN